MRRIIEAMQDATGTLLAFAIAAWAAHELYEAGYHQATRDAEPSPRPIAVPDPES